MKRNKNLILIWTGLYTFLLRRLVKIQIYDFIGYTQKKGTINVHINLSFLQLTPE